MKFECDLIAIGFKILHLCINLLKQSVTERHGRLFLGANIFKSQFHHITRL